MIMSVFLFFQASLPIWASIMEELQKLRPSRQGLKVWRITCYPFSSPFFQIVIVIKNNPINRAVKNKKVPITKKFSLSLGEEFFTYPFNKSPKYVRTSINKTPNPLLISLSSSYLKFFIRNIPTLLEVKNDRFNT